MNKQGISLPVNANKIMEDLNASREGMFSFYSLAHKIKADNKLKELQYRILTFTYNTNCLLFKKKLCSTVFCDFCAVERETVYHLYYDCTVRCFLLLETIRDILAKQHTNSSLFIKKRHHPGQHLFLRSIESCYTA